MTTNTVNSPARTTHAMEFIEELRQSIVQKTFAKLVLAKYRGPEAELTKTTVRLVVIKDQDMLSFVRHYRTNDITENLPVASGLEATTALVGGTFKAAHLLLSTGDIHIEFSRKGKCRLTRGAPTHLVEQTTEHNREKQRVIDRHRPFLHALGITSSIGQVLPSMSHKWKQISKFMEFFDHAVVASGLSAEKTISVVDFGSGKGYLTFAVHDFLRTTLGIDATVTGVELRENLVRFCNDTSSKLACAGLSFRQGEVASYQPGPIQALIALHACDIATDLAIHMGIRAGASVIMCAPCCHKQIRPQIKPPDVLKPVLRYGSHLAQEADMVTDTLRALLLEANGYEVGVFEFIALEHTDKNKMVLGVKRREALDPAPILARIKALKEFYGITEHKLESLLADCENKR